jgi:hypothetical protein
LSPTCGAGTDRIYGDALSFNGKVTPSAPPSTNDRIDGTRIVSGLINDSDMAA